MSLDRLMDIRARLATLTEPQREAPAELAPNQTDREARIEKELQSAIEALDVVIAEYRREGQEIALERELLRTTTQPLLPPSKPGPHEIKWGF